VNNHVVLNQEQPEVPADFISGRFREKGFDCSGFVSFVFNEFRVKLPRSSREYKALGIALKPEEFKVGDVLVFYGFRDRTHIGHVGIICEANGMKSRFIHASSGRAHSVTISDLGSDGYRGRFYKCIDVIR
jgi:cell wall-associated NlpC family hydrolase